MLEEDPLVTCRVLGVPMAATDYARAVRRAQRWAAGGGVHTIAAIPAYSLTVARRQADFAAILERQGMNLPDGMPVVWIMNRRLAQPLSDRVYGPTFMLRTLEATEGGEWTHFFLGGTDEMLGALEKNLCGRFPGLRIAGRYSPPFGHWDAAEDARIVEMIRASGANFVWVGLGSPKQERWVERVREGLPPAVYIAVGAAFAFHAGWLKQAPAWMQKRGLEWLFRLLAEPRRLWRRYLLGNALFLWYLLLDRRPGGQV